MAAWIMNSDDTPTKLVEIGTVKFEELKTF